MAAITEHKERQMHNEAFYTIRSRRNPSFYFKHLALDDYTLQGKRILDVGSGDSGFTAAAKTWGAKIAISLDPTYSSKPPIQFFNTESLPENPIAGLAQILPFRDDIFDETIAMWSILHIRSGRDLVIPEMLRVTKPGGHVRIFPLFGDEKPKPSPEEVKFIEWESRVYTAVLKKDPNIPTDLYLGQIPDHMWMF